MADEPANANVIQFRRACGDLPPSNDQGRGTVTLAFPNGRRLQYFTEGDQQGCSGSDPADVDPADWYGPEVRDLLLAAKLRSDLPQHSDL